MSEGLGGFIRGELGRAIREHEQDTAILTGLPRPESFVRMGLLDQPAEPDADLLSWPWEAPIPYDLPPKFHHNTIVMQVSTGYAVAMGLIEPPEGYVSWQPPPLPWRRRIRMRISMRVMRIRMRAASRLAAFDVEDRY